MHAKCAFAQTLTGFIWNIVVDATDVSLTKSSRLAIKEALTSHLLLTAVCDSALAAVMLVSVTTVLPDGIIVGAHVDHNMIENEY